MKIDSSFIGMESARSYTSVSKKNITTGLMGVVNMQGMQSAKDNFSELLHTGRQGRTSGNEIIATRGTYKSNRSITSIHEKKTLQAIKERCVQYLIFWLYTNALPQKSESMKSVKMNYYFKEREETSFQTMGMVKTSDGREINFNLSLSMSRSFMEYANIDMQKPLEQLTDPLIINLDTQLVTLSDQKFEFDLDSDGVKERISYMEGGAGFLALDKNGDGVINDGSELFGTKSGDGFGDLSFYDEDGNGWIDENDSVFDKLLIWTKNESGKDELYTLKKAGIGAMYLQKAETDFSLTSLKDNRLNGKIRSTGIFLYENGSVGTMQQIDLAH